ncbi:esterase/lipase family protein [Endothiovibrio diazotrophicus]
MLQNSNAVVVLVHGLWMGRWAMVGWERRLRRAGFQCCRFGYPTTSRPLEESVAALAARVAALEAPTVHFVAHSLGGILVLRYLLAHPEAPPGRVVLLGSPLRGSGVARRVVEWGWGRRLLKRAAVPLIEGVAQVPEGREVLMVAGDVAFGLGRVLPGLGSPSDGMVTLEETRLPGLAGHRVVGATHSGLLLSAEAMALAARFLGAG